MTMATRSIPRTGEPLPVVGLGTWQTFDVDLSPAQRAPRPPLAETARDTLAWWKAQPPERRVQPRAGLSDARERELLAAWKAR